jgi:hypothetical protein
MEIKKIFIYLNLILSITFINAVSIVEKSSIVEETTNEGLKSIVLTIVTIGIMILLFLFFVFVLAVIIIKIQKKMSDYMRKKKDFLFVNFEENLTQCQLNKDPVMKYKRFRSLFILWTRNPVYMNSKKYGVSEIGSYDGETMKKENFFLLAINNKISFFKSKQMIIVLPSEWHEKIFKKVIINKKKVILLECEGIDEIGSTDYYYQPLIPSIDKTYNDISDLFRTQFTEKIVYRNIIKDQLQEHRSAIIKAVESNPYIHQNRRKD